MNLHPSSPQHLLARLPVLLPVAAALTLPLGSCSVTSGAAIGGVLGAGLGQAIGGDTESTVLGGVIGAGVGAAIGYNVAKKREARELASREATEAELKAVQVRSAAIAAASRERAIERAEAYAKVHGDEHRAAAVDAPFETSDPAVRVEAEPMTEDAAQDPVQVVAEASIPDDSLIGIVPLPNDDGVVFTNVKTGELLDNEVHYLEEIKDVSDDASSSVEEDDDAKPFTLILSDKKTGKTRQYTAIYNT